MPLKYRRGENLTPIAGQSYMPRRNREFREKLLCPLPFRLVFGIGKASGINCTI
jgi:hypothetical protein